MKCLIRFMRKECERRRIRKIGIVGEGNDLGAMVDAVAPKLVSERIWGLGRRGVICRIPSQKITSSRSMLKKRGQRENY